MRGGQLSQSEVLELINHIADNADYFISFLDAQAIIESLEQVRFISTPLALSLSQLLEHPRLTLGAAKILSPFNQRLQENITEAWHIGQSVIGIHSNNRDVRLQPEQALVISLPEKGPGYPYWNIEKIDGPVQTTMLRHYPPSEDSSFDRGHFRVEAVCTHLGAARLELSLALDNRVLDSFILYVLVEYPPPLQEIGQMDE